MPASSLDRVRDPLSEKFTVDELPSIAPWVYEEITALGVEEIMHTVADLGENPNDPQSMTTWVTAINRNHSDLWQSLASG